MIEREKLTAILAEHDHAKLFSLLAGRSDEARKSFSRMYRMKPFHEWTQTELENTLGYMMGHNVIHG